MQKHEPSTRNRRESCNAKYTLHSSQSIVQTQLSETLEREKKLTNPRSERQLKIGRNLGWAHFDEQMLKFGPNYCKVHQQMQPWEMECAMRGWAGERLQCTMHSYDAPRGAGRGARDTGTYFLPPCDAFLQVTSEETADERAG